MYTLPVANTELHFLFEENSFLLREKICDGVNHTDLKGNTPLTQSGALSVFSFGRQLRLPDARKLLKAVNGASRPLVCISPGRTSKPRRFKFSNTTPKQKGGSMKDVTVRQLEMASRVVGFLRENPIAFRKGSVGADLVEQIKKQVDEIKSLTATQSAQIGLSRANSRTRGAARQSLNAMVEQISRTAQAIEVTNPGMEARFQAIRGVGDAKLETRARALAENARPYVKEFVEFEMKPQFIAALESNIEAFTEAVANHKASRAAHAATSQLIDDAMERALTTIEQLDAIMQNKMGDNTALQLKWENVRHIERRWISKKTEDTPEKSPAPLAPAA
jgi:hypothetical protein